MLGEPNVTDLQISDCVSRHYGVKASEIEFLPIGADSDTAVYRVSTDDSRAYFLKLRSGDAEDTSVVLSKFLSEQGVRQVIPPIQTVEQRPTSELECFIVALYPFVDGRSGFDVELSDGNWAVLGTTLRAIHTVVVPTAIAGRLGRETYSAHWRDAARMLLADIDDLVGDAIVKGLVDFLKARRDQILGIVDRAERLAEAVKSQSTDFVLCHADIHAGNVLIGDKDDLYIVDWDTAILAPKERDLMFVGGGVGGTWNQLEDVARFYSGYGGVDVDHTAIAYYRYERTVEDIAVTCQEVLSTDLGQVDREERFRQLTLMFTPNNVIDMALYADESLKSAT